MGAHYQKGRADAAKGHFDPPKAGFFASKSESEKAEQAKQEYREGYYDKRREMGKKD